MPTSPIHRSDMAPSRRFEGRSHRELGLSQSIARENHGTDHTQSCLTAKPPMHHRRVLVWLWRLVAAGWKPRPFRLCADTPAPFNTAPPKAPKIPPFRGVFRLRCFLPFPSCAALPGKTLLDNTNN